ncbi:MAG: hypothetical protein II863_10470 [Kiritimatiellae bacterium]|nr:hypothetical protein [Kiritimatiellia bacterium]
MQQGVPGLLCAKTRFVSIAAIPHILFHMCRQIGFALRATTKRGCLPSGFAAGTARRRFDLKVELQAIRLPFDIPAPSTFVKRRRAIPTFGSRQAPRHEPGFARHEYPRISQLPTLFPRCVFLDRINRIYKILAVCKCFWRFHNPDNPVNPVQKKFCNCRK